MQTILGIDTGGTFTDFILLGPDGTIQSHKEPSTPDDPARAVLAGIGTLDPARNRLAVIHGTTVGTNAFLERKGARVLLVTTHGFEDILFIGRQHRERIFDLDATRPLPIIGPEAVTGVRERVLFNGQVQTPLGASAGRRLRRICRQHGFASVAVCLLHAYANPVHEQAIARALAPTGIPVTLSSQLLPEFREYERLTTTLINAYLAPVLTAYVHRLQRHLAPVPLFIQQSNGSVLPAAGIARRAVHTILSGPAGGVQGALAIGEAIGQRRLITFDMGGTSTDVSCCDNGPTMTRDYRIDGYPLRNQVIDIHTVGAGGGSVAWIDAGGLLQVGPESAGADPGPVCYGKGDRVTVTDANLFLGRLPDRLLGGRMSLDRERAGRHLARLGTRLNMTAEETALGIIAIVNATMCKAIRAVSLERGHDPRDFVLFSFGGASGLHCCALATELGIATIVAPERAGILSAQGMALTDPAIDLSQTLFLCGRTVDTATLASAIDRLAAAGRNEARRLGLQGELHTEAAVDMRYRGQAHELTIPWTSGLEAAFHQAHHRLFGYAMHTAPLEVVGVRCRVRVQHPHPGLPPAGAATGAEPEPAGRRPVVFAARRRTILPVYQRRDLRHGHRFSGPALVEDQHTTILVAHDFQATVDGLGNLLLHRRQDGTRA